MAILYGYSGGVLKCHRLNDSELDDYLHVGWWFDVFESVWLVPGTHADDDE